MRTFVITKNGVARIMRTYAVDPVSGHVLPDDPDAPDAVDEIAKWHPDHQAAVTSVREIAEADVPSSTDLREAWRDDGANITVDVPAARDAHAERIVDAQASELARLKIAERKQRLKGNTAQADQSAADLTALEALDLDELAAQIQLASDATALAAIWPAGVPK
jgi:hypothetical protein